MGRLQDNINSLRNSLKEIRTALNSRGAGIVEGDNLDTWDNKINNMPDVHTGVGSATNNYYPLYLKVVDKFEMPTQDNEGHSLYPYIFDNQGATQYQNGLASQLLGIAKTVTIPSYFTRQCMRANWMPNEVIGATVEVFNHNGVVASHNYSGNSWQHPSFTSMGAIKNLRQLNINKLETIDGFYFGIQNDTSQDYGKITINCKKVKTMTSNSGRSLGGDTTNGYCREIDWNFPELLSITLWYQNSLFANSTGVINMPKLESIVGNYNWNKSNTTGKFYTIKCPSLRTMSNTYFGTQGNGGIKLYIGPNLSSAVAAIGNAEIHIPAGDSTTKTTLDGLGVSYIQDYTL